MILPASAQTFSRPIPIPQRQGSFATDALTVLASTFAAKQTAQKSNQDDMIKLLSLLGPSLAARNQLSTTGEEANRINLKGLPFPLYTGSGNDLTSVQDLMNAPASSVPANMASAYAKAQGLRPPDYQTMFEGASAIERYRKAHPEATGRVKSGNASVSIGQEDATVRAVKALAAYGQPGVQPTDNPSIDFSNGQMTKAETDARNALAGLLTTDESDAFYKRFKDVGYDHMVAELNASSRFDEKKKKAVLAYLNSLRGS